LSRPPARERAAGAALALAGFLFIAVATLTPLPNVMYSLPRTCIVCGELGVVDVVNNILLFVPLGAGLTLTGVRRRTAVALCVALTVTVETLQIGVIAGRDANVGDVMMNTIGGALGVALAATWRRWLRPGPSAARGLAAAAGAAWLAILAGSGWALQRTAPPGEYAGQIVPEVDGYSLLRGYVLAATLDGAAIPAGDVHVGDTLRRTLLADSVAVEARVTTGSVPRRLAPVAIMWSPQRGELFALGQRGRDLVFRMRMHAADALVRAPSAVIPDAFPFVPVWPLSERTPPDTMRVAGGVRGHALYAEATLHGRTVRHEVALAVTLGWSFFFPFEYRYGPELPLLTALWVGGLLVPFGYWSARGTGGTTPAAWIATTLAMLALGLGALPVLWDLHASRWWEWAAAAAGLGAGWGLGRWSTARRTADDDRSPSTQRVA
jgi:VanZ family protein